MNNYRDMASNQPTEGEQESYLQVEKNYQQFHNQPAGNTFIRQHYMF